MGRDTDRDMTSAMTRDSGMDIDRKGDMTGTMTGKDSDDDR